MISNIRYKHRGQLDDKAISPQLFYHLNSILQYWFTSFADKNTATTKIPKQICYKHGNTKCSHPLLLLNLYANGGGPT